MEAQAITPETLQSLLLGDGELALLDVREARAFHAAHLNLARSAPLSGLESQVTAFVPRRSVAVVLYDDAGRPRAAAARAATLLQRLGYEDVRVLAGGLHAWREQGLPSIDGWNTLVKAFGDRVRQHYATRVLPLQELQALREGKTPVVLVDVRPADEFAFLSIAGAHNHAGTELALRDFPQAGDGAPLWAINCFSRTRGILGATTLAMLGHPHAAFVEDGVMAWSLRGGAVERAARAAPDLQRAPAEVLERRAAQLRARSGVSVIDAAQLVRWRADPSRTLYIFDVRPEPGEATAAAADARHVPGGQVLMHFEQLVGTRNARVVLVDDAHGLRAAVTAFWLRQFNQCEVFVLEGEVPSWSAPVDAELDADAALPAQPADPRTLHAWLAEGQATVVDVGPSEDFERAHIPGSSYLLPSTLSPLAALVAQGRILVLTSPDGAAARIAAKDTAREWPRSARIFWLEGGTQAWAAQGHATTSRYRQDDLLTPFDDDWGSTMRVAPPHLEAAWRQYLAWERALSARVACDPTVRFKVLDLPTTPVAAHENPHIHS